MEENRQDFITDRLMKIDLYSLLKDLGLNVWVILLCALIAGVWGNMYASYTSHSGTTYTSSTTLIVSVKGGESNVYSNLSSTQTMATSLSSIMQSKLMQKRVCEELELTSFNAQVSAKVVDKTNLLVVSVTDTSAELAYRELKSIMNNYEDLADSLIGSIMVETLAEPTVAKYANQHFDVLGYTEKGAAIGFLIGLLLVCFCSIMNDTIKGGQDLSDKLDAKNLGVIDFEKKYKTFGDRFKHKKSGLLVTNATTSFDFVECYRKIAAKASYLKKGDEGVSIVVTSVMENEGKSTVTANLAISLAENGKDVILIDCDLRKPSQDLLLYDAKTERKTLHDYLTGKCALMDIIAFDDSRGIYTILTGQETDSASELLSGEKMRDMIFALKKQADYIILDTPPLSVAADAESLADHADASILVVRYDTVQAADINDAIDLLSGCRAEVAGCILNQAHHIGGSMIVGKNSDGQYGKYGNYGKYGDYGKYGKYGKYGHYASYAAETKSTAKASEEEKA